VTISINDEVCGLRMRLGSSGEAYFIEVFHCLLFVVVVLMCCFKSDEDVKLVAPLIGDDLAEIDLHKLPAHSISTANGISPPGVLLLLLLLFVCLFVCLCSSLGLQATRSVSAGVLGQTEKKILPDEDSGKHCFRFDCFCIFIVLTMLF
jgi:hypothetical protein